MVPLGAAAEAYAAGEAALEDREPAVGLEADQEELARLIGGEGEAGAHLGQPGGEKSRAGQLEPGSLVFHALASSQVPADVAPPRLAAASPWAGRPHGLSRARVGGCGRAERRAERTTIGLLSRPAAL